jgi:hypothetical protein
LNTNRKGASLEKPQKYVIINSVKSYFDNLVFLTFEKGKPGVTLGRKATGPLK